MILKLRISIIALACLAAIAVSLLPERNASSASPVIAQATPTPGTPPKANSGKLPTFDKFVQSLKNGNSTQLVGVYVAGVLSSKIIQQPASQPAFVSSTRNVVTEFALAHQYTGNIGLLAHNYAAGGQFFQLAPGHIIQLIYGDGNVVDYEVTEMRRYQALEPENPNTQFVDLASGQPLSASDLFYSAYGGSLRTTLQTCIAAASSASWGRLFIIAPPY